MPTIQLETGGMPRSVLRHRPIGSELSPSVQEWTIQTPRATRTKAHPELRRTSEAPSSAKTQRRPHTLVLVGLSMLLTLVLLATGSYLWSCGRILLDDLRYGSPRTTHVDYQVGHSKTPSHFEAMNEHGQIYILEIPGDNAASAHLLVGPQLVGPGADLAPVTLSFVGDLHHPDLLVTVASTQMRFHNTGTTYQPINS